MAEVVILRGYSGSGKSTFAKTLTEKGYVRVNRDNLRTMLTGREEKFVGDPGLESRVTRLEANAVKDALSKGKNVVVDDTNLNPKFAQEWVDIATVYGASYRVVDIDTPIDVCVERGAHWAPQQAKRYPRNKWPELKPKTLPWEPIIGTSPGEDEVVLCDLDGTLSILAKGYSPYDPEHYLHDTANPAVLEVLYAFTCADVEILFMSGREGTQQGRADTKEWLARHGYGGHQLFMRPEGDGRPDWIVKNELFDKHINGKYNVLLCLDDRDQVVNAYRHRGLSVFQVNPGGF